MDNYEVDRHMAKGKYAICLHLELEDTEIFERYLFWRTLTICAVLIPDRNDDGTDGEGLAES